MNIIEKRDLLMEIVLKGGEKFNDALIELERMLGDREFINFYQML